MTSYKNVFYMVIVRAEDKTPLAKFGSDQYVAKVQELLAAPHFHSKVSSGQRMRVESETECYNFNSGAGITIIAVTSKNYPERVVFPGLIEDARTQFIRAFAGKWQVANEGGLSSKFKKSFASLFQEYDDVEAKSQIVRLQGQVNAVTEQMKGNISKALENLEATQNLQDKSETLLANSKKFEGTARKLSCAMYWQLLKLRLLVFFLVVLVIIVVLAAAGVFNPPADSGGSATAVTTAPPRL